MGEHMRHTLRWLWRVLWRGKFLVLGTWLLAIVPTVLVLQQTVPLYTAEAEVLIEGPEATDALADQRRDFGFRVTENVVNTEAEVIASSMLAYRVVDKLQLDRDPEFNPMLREPRPIDRIIAWANPLTWLVALSRSPDPATSRRTSDVASDDVVRSMVVRTFLTRLDARMQRRSFIVTVHFTSEDPKKAALIANTVVELYMLDRLEASFDDARRLTSWLGERLEGLRRDVNATDSAVEEFRAANNLRRKGERQTTVTDQQLSELNTRIVIARSELAQKQARLDQVRQLLRSRGSMETSSEVLQSSLIQRLREQETALTREMSEAIKTYGERHPRMVAYRADLTELRSKIGGEIEKIAASIANDVDVSAAGLRTLEKELDGVRQRSNVAGEAEIRLRELERQAEATRELYEAFLARFKRDAEQDRVKRVNARVIARPDAPTSPAFPRRAAVMSMVSAVSLAIVLVFLLDHLDNAVRSSDEAEEISGLPTVALVPVHRGRTDRLVQDVTERPRSVLADAVRSLRISLDVGIGDGAARPRILVLTSSIPKEGKTFLALSLAIMFTKTNERVLLIDGDVHRPRMHTMLGRPNAEGLVQVLSGSAAFEDVVIRDAAPGLDFLPAGHLANVADLISEPTARALLDDLRGKYDRIVIDSAPVLAVADARVLGRLADRVIYLVKWNSTARDAVRNGVRLLRDGRAPLHGIVLSQVNQRKHARYAYGDYGQYYGRYRDYYGE
ncbi:AAA family ATPase [Azospirillum sp. RWY-5-1]|uniref:non-specific protein-tyrosine kinase n=2 Tax=Azospirillum oleiclasticum TaxID=2735135 RepID=A0ABX2TM78_9PROT|nr:AAA family ATPase [Azospirillum oleiclasticum]NYZ23885.1 AAA family ATPase [Azospirillum oleiclasticum]